MKKGFTLIELLIVVLVIGILAAIALPQYRKAVEKSKASQAFAMIRTIAAAQESYYMANGTYARTFDELSVDIPWTEDIRWLSGGSSRAARANNDWSVQFYHEASGEAIAIGRISGLYKGAGFMYFFSNTVNMPNNTVVCRERTSSGGVTFDQPRGTYCTKLFPTLPFTRF